MRWPEEEDDGGMETRPEPRNVRTWRRSLERRSASAKPPSVGARSPSASDATPTIEDSGVGVYGAFVDAELRAQDLRKSSFEQRGLAVVTTSGVLVTLLFALAGLSTKSEPTFALPHTTRLWLVSALIVFVIAAATVDRGSSRRIPVMRHQPAANVSLTHRRCPGTPATPHSHYPTLTRAGP
jgi:hypothetical protein